MTKNNMPLALAVAALLMITTAGFAQDQKDPQKQRPRTTSSARFWFLM